MKRKKCSKCDYPIFSKGLCKWHWNIEFGKPIKKVSKSHQKTLNAYSPERKKFLEANPYCQLKLDTCTYYATCVHHKKAKHSKELYLDVEYWMASCIACNGRVEEIGEKAYELGLKIKHNSI